MDIENIIGNSKDRLQLWTSFVKHKGFKNIVELGVYRGEFAENILLNCDSIEKYYMIDPWRKLKEWNKPANTEDEIFEDYYNETLKKTEFVRNKRIILRGKTQEMHQEINNDSLDFAYIDGDHTLKGITVDLIAIWDKIKSNGFIAGDDFCSSVWQHDKTFEPTFVFPFAVYFAEAKNVKIYALPFNQFLISKGSKGYELIDLTNGKYNDLSVLNQLKVQLPKKRNTFLSNFFK
ncbi:class I SAM-dependent methyltransferase [Flavobacterium sp. 5]|uniref:class I SAM-dependent methyltransferase n=1 Tax=Flavobacterium sp. 5 TaxID=2035199 RepID=UPI000C2C8CEA|nr:class I SAM-dependent methyltransferase [Flavobacterium sp. 5]PKB17448.1 methyltransferase family protein [Flavobacterium sp. 5]